VLEKLLLEKLVRDGLSPAEAAALIAEYGSSLKGLAKSNAYSGDPINMSTGNFVYQKEDLVIPGAFPLRYARCYNSVQRTFSTVGLGWTHSFDIHLDDCGHRRGHPDDGEGLGRNLPRQLRLHAAASWVQ
jgi:hypothetical protein